jgi:hypothetical protein
MSNIFASDPSIDPAADYAGIFSNAGLQTAIGTDGMPFNIAPGNPDAATQLARLNADLSTPALDTSTLDIFGSQLYNDPFGAPIAQADTIVNNTGSALKSAAGNTVGQIENSLVGGYGSPAPGSLFAGLQSSIGSLLVLGVVGFGLYVGFRIILGVLPRR